MSQSTADALDQCKCPGCDRCEPAGGPCSREVVEESDRRCREYHDRAAEQWADTIPPGPKYGKYGGDIPPR